MEAIDFSSNARPGYRLAYFEVFNWGTFDSSRGQVYRMEPQGRTALLVGQNGSGKSTLVDALLTLLVQPGVRNYNVAAGSKKRERDERSYIKGACGSASSDDDGGAVTQYLRPNANHFSLLLASFRREDTEQHVTVAQVLYLASDGTVEKFYAMANDARSIEVDLSNLQREQRLLPQLHQRGFRVTTKYTEYFGWLTNALQLRPKALDMFNQTVAVKDIQSLNRFIRDHMLEERPWHDKVDNLLTHFSQLSQAYQSLVRARRQVEQLLPIEKLITDIQQLDRQIDKSKATLEATESFFCHKTIRSLEPQMLQVNRDIQDIKSRVSKLDQHIEESNDTYRRLKNDLELGGGHLVQEIPRQIATESEKLNEKQRLANDFQDRFRRVGIEIEVGSLEGFENALEQMNQRRVELEQHLAELDGRRSPLLVELSQFRQTAKSEQIEFDSLAARTSNIPPWLNDVRSKLLKALELAEDDLPFAAELIAVRDECRDWQSSIEMVLRSFALSLIVPEKWYRAVSEWIEKNRLEDDNGRGQRLVYLKALGRTKGLANVPIHSQSLIRRVELRPDHPLHDWIRGELIDRYDYRCCETIEEFQASPRLAITKKRHTKSGDARHEKDDRDKSSDPRTWVLGWNNSNKKAKLAESLDKLLERESHLRASLRKLDEASASIQSDLDQVQEAFSVRHFEQLDWQSHQLQIERLRGELEGIGNRDEAVRVIHQRLKECDGQRKALQAERDACLSSIGQRESQLADAGKILSRAKKRLVEAKLTINEKELAACYAMLESELPPKEMHWDELHRLELERVKRFHSELSKLHDRRDPMAADLARMQQRFMNEFPELAVDLQAGAKFNDSFVALLETLRADNLPRLEQRFKERLSEKVLQEIGIFHANLQSEKQDLLNRIDALNESLRQLEYRPGTYMKLEPRLVNDPEIRAFQNALRDCILSEGSEISDLESRLVQLEKLIDKLRDDERWRDKVTDVRRWFDFAAREIDLASGAERGYYEDSAGQSGGEKAKLAFTILVAAIAYQYNIDPQHPNHDRLHFVVVDEMFSKVDDRYAEYALQLFEKFGLQLLIVAPLDAKARVTESHVGCYLHTIKDEKTKTSQIVSMSATEYEEAMVVSAVRKGSEQKIRRIDLPHTRPRRPR